MRFTMWVTHFIPSILKIQRVISSVSLLRRPGFLHIRLFLAFFSPFFPSPPAFIYLPMVVESDTSSFLGIDNEVEVFLEGHNHDPRRDIPWDYRFLCSLVRKKPRRKRLNGTENGIRSTRPEFLCLREFPFGLVFFSNRRPVRANFPHEISSSPHGLSQKFQYICHFCHFLCFLKNLALKQFSNLSTHFTFIFRHIWQ